MKKLGLLILSIFGIGLLSNQCFGYDVIIYGEDNQLLFMYDVEEGTTEIILEGDRTKNGNNYTFNGGFSGLKVNYVDGYGDNQEFTTNSDIYINGDLSLGYTGEQYLSLTDNTCGVSNGFTPNFVFTGTTEVTESGNMFNNFSDNAFKVLLSNIPSYIQYVTIFAILFFLFGFLRRFKRKR